jgi:RNA methyltransferase, TrmH family
MAAPAAQGARHRELDRLRRLARRRSDRLAERAFVIEGPKAISDALDAAAPVEVLYTDGSASPDLLERAARAGVPVRTVGPGVLDRVADTVTPQGVIGIAACTDVALADVQRPTLAVVAVDVQDPGNAGTILRTAEAAGASAVVFAGASVDAFHPKVVRASAGSLFHVQVVNGGVPVDVLEQLGGRGLRRLATAAEGGTPLDDVDLTVPVALVLGNEGRGLGEEIRPAVDELVTIPMAGRSESLNVGMAGAVLCFEAARQRRRAGTGHGS